jgi:rubredoxin
VLYDPEKYPPRNEIPPETILENLDRLYRYFVDQENPIQ